MESADSKKRYRPTIRREREILEALESTERDLRNLADKYETLQRSNELMEAELKRRAESIETLTDDNIKLRAENERLSNRSIIDRILNK